MSKRTKFIVVGILVAFCLWLTNLFDVELKFGLTLAVVALTYLLSVWVLFEDLKGIEWLTLMVLPTMFTLGAALFANFLPVSIPRLFGRVFEVELAMLLASILRVIYYVLVALCLYGVLLIENIFSVASIRTIQLFRAARSVNFILTLLTALFLFTTVFGLKIPFYWIATSVFLITFILSFPSMWSVDLKLGDQKTLTQLSLAIGLTMALIAISLSFWPIKAFMAGLMLTSVLYAQLGIIEQRLSSRVYLEGLMEYAVTVLTIVFVGYWTTSWTGG